MLTLSRVLVVKSVASHQHSLHLHGPTRILQLERYQVYQDICHTLSSLSGFPELRDTLQWLKRKKWLEQGLGSG